MNLKNYITLLFFAFFLTFFSIAQESKPLTRILFIFDASNSMNGKWDEATKISIAKKLLSQAVDSLKGKENLEIALRVYGHQTAIVEGQQDCNDTKLEVAFEPNNFNKVKGRIKSVIPKGTTPIARSLEKSAEDFPKCSTCKNVIILITDGIEACDQDPCAVAQALRSKGISVKPFVVGVGLDLSYLETLGCIGTFYDATDASTFKNVLNLVLSQAINNTTAQVNLKDINGKNIETNVPMTFYDSKSGVIKYQFLHTMNRKKLPDTLSIDPVGTYRVKVHTIPAVEIDNVLLKANMHNHIDISTPQGKIELKTRGKKGKSIDCIVRKNKDCKTINNQPFGTKEKYLVGSYQLEIQTLPRIIMNDVEVKQSSTNTILIPEAGVLHYSSKNLTYGAIFVLDRSKMEWVTNLNPEEQVRKLDLQPGRYKIVYRKQTAKSSTHTKEKYFSIFSGEQTTLNF